LIGDNIRITVQSVRGDAVRLAIFAPPDVLVDREEIRERREVTRYADDDTHNPDVEGE
jgi:carbon storage regulator CsrA